MAEERTSGGPLGPTASITDEEGGMFDIDALVRDVMEHGAAGEAARRNAAARRPLAGGCEIGAAAPAKRDEKDEQ